jgi:hypothetical protein
MVRPIAVPAVLFTLAISGSVIPIRIQKTTPDLTGLISSQRIKDKHFCQEYTSCDILIRLAICPIFNASFPKANCG